MNDALWFVCGLYGIVLTVAAGDLGARTYLRRGHLHGFGSPRAFATTYRITGLALFVPSAIGLLWRPNLNPLGLFFIAGGVELCLRSHDVGTSMWQGACRHPDLAAYKRGVFLAGIWFAMIGIIGLFRL